MLKLAEIIREGLKAKLTHPKKTVKNTSPVETFQSKIATPTPELKIGKEPTPPSLPLETLAEEKLGAGFSIIDSISKEIENAEINIDEAGCLYNIGNIASVDFKSMEKSSTVMATSKVKGAIKEALLKKYKITPEELDKEISKHDKKIKSLATRCYIHVLRQRM